MAIGMGGVLTQAGESMERFQPPGFQKRMVDSPLGRMAVYTQGQPPPGPSLLFLHSLGGGSSAYEWSRVYAALGADYPIVAVDLVGWGQADHPRRDYRVEDYCAMITTLVEDVTGPGAIAIASSLTAGVLIRLSLQKPDLFAGLILVSPAGNDDFGRGYRYTLPALLASTPGIDQSLYALGAANPIAVEQFLTNFLLAQPQRLTPRTIAAYLASTQQPNAQYAALASLKGDICFDLTRYLPQLTTPTWILLGATSKLNPARQGQRLAALSPAVRQVKTLDGVGVLPHLEYPALVIPWLRAWIRLASR